MRRKKFFIGFICGLSLFIYSQLTQARVCEELEGVYSVPSYTEPPGFPEVVNTILSKQPLGTPQIFSIIPHENGNHSYFRYDTERIVNITLKKTIFGSYLDSSITECYASLPGEIQIHSVDFSHSSSRELHQFYDYIVNGWFLFNLLNVENINAKRPLYRAKFTLRTLKKLKFVAVYRSKYLPFIVIIPLKKL